MSTLNFEYRAVDQRGSLCQGVTHAASQSEAHRRLKSIGLTPVRLRVVGASGKSLLGLSRRRLGGRELAHFTYSLGVLISARVPISDGLLSIAQQEKDTKTRDMIVDIAKRIEAGAPVADAMEAHSDALGDVYVQTVRAAEKSGNLPKVLEHLSEMLERSQETTRMVRSAMMYPICVVGALAAAMVFLVTFVVPKFAKMFASKGAALPFLTSVLMDIGLSVQNYWFVYLAVIVGAAVGARWMLIRPQWQTRIDACLHRVPLLRDILVGLAISRFCRILGLSLSSGLGLIESLELAGKASGRPLLMRDVETMITQIRTGGRLATVLNLCGYLSPFTKRMLTAGEEAAEIPRMCGVISRHYERETAYMTKNMGTVIEPVLIIGIAGMVLVVALAIFMPMWDVVRIVA